MLIGVNIFLADWTDSICLFRCVFREVQMKGPEKTYCIRTLALVSADSSKFFTFSCSLLTVASVLPLRNRFGSFSRVISYHIAQPEVTRHVQASPFGIDIAYQTLAAALLKAFLPFDFVNTSGQKPSTLRVHFTQPY